MRASPVSLDPVPVPGTVAGPLRCGLPPVKTRVKERPAARELRQPGGCSSTRRCRDGSGCCPAGKERCGRTCGWGPQRASPSRSRAITSSPFAGRSTSRQVGVDTAVENHPALPELVGPAAIWKTPHHARSRNQSSRAARSDCQSRIQDCPYHRESCDRWRAHRFAD
jgi:hypothetical protein